MSLRRPVRESAAQPGFPERSQVGGGELGAADVVAPVVDERESAEQRLDGGQAGSLVHVAGREQLAQGRDGREIAELALVAGHAPEQRVPHVPVRVNEARQHDGAASVDHLSAGGLEVGADGNDRACLDVHVAAGDVPDRRVHRHHVGAANDELATRRQLARRRLGALALDGSGDPRRADRAHRRGAAQKGPSAHPGLHG